MKSYYKGEFIKKILQQNQFLLNKINKLEKTQKSSQRSIKELVIYKQKIENEQQIKDLNRQKRQHSQPFQKNFIPWVMEAINNFDPSPSPLNLTKIGLSVAVICLRITGLRIS